MKINLLKGQVDVREDSSTVLFVETFTKFRINSLTTFNFLQFQFYGPLVLWGIP